MKKIKKYTFLLLVVFTVVQKSSAQKITNEELLTLQLPPIETLYEGAKKSNTVEFYASRMEGEELALKSEKRRWLEYFSLSATFQYGVMGMNSYSDVGANYPIIYQNSASDQLWYNVGAAIRIPLANIFDRRNRIRKQQLKIKETLNERDMWFDEQKLKIVGLYTQAEGILIHLKRVVELATLSDAQYNVAQNEYIMGTSTAMTLSTAKSMQVQTFVQMETLKAELKANLLQLEIITNIKIVNIK